MAETAQRIHHLDGRNDIINRLEHILKMARNGELNAVAIATCQNDGGVGSSFCITSRGNQWTLLGSIESLKYELLNDGSDQNGVE
jgi:hypothetical protein